MSAALGIALLVALAVWLFGGLLARWGGAFLVVGGALGLAFTGEVDGLLAIALGVGLWAAGQLHFALRHGYPKSALARRLWELSVARRARAETVPSQSGQNSNVLRGGGDERLNRENDRYPYQ